MERDDANTQSPGEPADRDFDREFAELTEAEGSVPSRIGMAVGTLVVLALIGFWAYAFIRGPGVAHKDELVSIEERERWVDYAAAPIQFRTDPNIADAPLDDATAIEFMVFAELRCAQMLVDLAVVPRAQTAQTFEERADITDRGTDVLESAIEDIATSPRPTETNDATISEAWLDDYRVYIADRRAHAARVRDGYDGPLELSASRAEGVRVTRLLRTFAEVNSMYSCVPPDDA